jgi:colanic acid/amylovoran biosynthesis glycosyltransferase
MACGTQYRGRDKLEALKVAYIVLRFPFLTETFVADEIWEMQQQGVPVHLYSLLRPREEPVHPTSQHLAKDTQYAPGFFSGRLWWAQIYFLVRSPVKYVALWIQLIRQPYPRNFGSLFLKRAFIFLKAVSLALALKDASVKVIHSHFAWLSGAAAMVISSLLDIPFTVTVHAYDIYASNELLCLIARSASHIIAISEYNKQMVLEACPGLEEDSISVIHCGINLDLFTSRARTHREGPLSILSIGSLIEKKGHKYLIRACQQLKARGIDFRCTIVGKGPSEGSLRQLVRDCNLEDYVVLAGSRSRDDVLDAYHRSDLFVLASAIGRSGDRDGIPVVLMEALAMQIPAIATEVSGIPELVRHKVTGWLVPERDPMAIAEAIALLAYDDRLRALLAHNGRALVEREFEIKGNVSRLINVFQQVVAHSTS